MAPLPLVPTTLAASFDLPCFPIVQTREPISSWNAHQTFRFGLSLFRVDPSFPLRAPATHHSLRPIFGPENSVPIDHCLPRLGLPILLARPPHV